MWPDRLLIDDLSALTFHVTAGEVDEYAPRTVVTRNCLAERSS